MNTYQLKTDNIDDFMRFIIEAYEYVQLFDFDTDYDSIEEKYYYILSIKTSLREQILTKSIAKYNITII